MRCISSSHFWLCDLLVLEGMLATYICVYVVWCNGLSVKDAGGGKLGLNCGISKRESYVYICEVKCRMIGTEPNRVVRMQKFLRGD